MMQQSGRLGKTASREKLYVLRGFAAKKGRSSRSREAARDVHGPKLPDPFFVTKRMFKEHCVK